MLTPEPLYIPDFVTKPGIERLVNEVPWLRVAETRSESFMSAALVAYTYGRGRGVRTYTSGPFTAGIDDLLEETLNPFLAELGYGPLNVCFCNMYKNERDHLGWHADDHDGTDHARPIAVVSFGEPREIWWRPAGADAGAPAPMKQLLGNGSLFLMPPGFQQTHQHRIPKASRVAQGPRVSLTFRAFVAETRQGA